MTNGMTPPIPYYGRKVRWARDVWARLGNPDVYVEPCGGSLAVLLARPHDPRTEIVSDTSGLVCLAPETLVLDANFQYRPIGDLKVGDELLAFDEFNGPLPPGQGRRSPTRYRRWRKTKVTATRRVQKPCHRLRFSDGTEITASEDHQWLSGGGPESSVHSWTWATTRGLVPREGHGARSSGSVSHVLKPAPSPADLRGEDYTTGWLGGIADGEGNLVATRGLQLAITQNPGPVQQLIEGRLNELGFNYRTYKTEKGTLGPIYTTLSGGEREILRFLIDTKPVRLIKKFLDNCEHRSIYGRKHNGIGLDSKKPIGIQEVVALETDSHTFIAEGLASHNCNFFRAVREDPDGLARMADYPTIDDDLIARHRWLMRWRDENAQRLIQDPDWYDLKAAGWWGWGASSWVGSGWCLVDEDKRPKLPDGGGQGIQAQRMELPGEVGTGERLVPWFRPLARRLSRVVILNRDWKVAVTDTALREHRKQPLTVGIFLDPPYRTEGRKATLYQSDIEGTSDRTAQETWEWARFTGERYRIAYACREGDVEPPPGWEAMTMEFAGIKRPDQRETKDMVLFSPACILPQPSLFGPDF